MNIGNFYDSASDSVNKLISSYGIELASGLSPLPQGGSDRKYYRTIFRGKPAVLSLVNDTAESRCFVALARAFRCVGQAVPEIYFVTDDYKLYIQEDLGDHSLFSLLKDVNLKSLVVRTLVNLVDLQKTDRSLWEKDCIYGRFDKRQVMWDLNYFKYGFLKPTGVVMDEAALEDDFEKLSDRLIAIPEEFYGFMMRDCQSRNVMITEKGPVFIDFQGGRLGPVLYDVVSFLWQARAGFSHEFRMRMLDFYSDLFCNSNPGLRKAMSESLPEIVLFRTLQVLGAYGFRGLVEHRAHFLMSIPSAMKNLCEIIDNGWLNDYPELKRVCVCLVRNNKFAASCNTDVLNVEIFSFSYKRGYPEDLSGNGGGFMFDCRAMHNPGRYEKYKKLTGRDKEVKDFLEQRGEVFSFLNSVWGLTDPAIERYLSRGFSNLQIGFGCTGGQHRSVYCAEATALHVKKVFPEANVILRHREHPED